MRYAITHLESILCSKQFASSHRQASLYVFYRTGCEGLTQAGPRLPELARRYLGLREMSRASGVARIPDLLAYVVAANRYTTPRATH